MTAKPVTPPAEVPIDLFARCGSFLERHRLGPAGRWPDRDAWARRLAPASPRAAPTEPPMLEILTGEVAETVGQIPETAADDIPAETFARLGLAVYLADELELRAEICRRLAEDPRAPELVFTYLELTEDLAFEGQLWGETFVRLDRLPAAWGERLGEWRAELGDEAFQRELEAIADLLAEGCWPERLAEVVERTLMRALGGYGGLERLRRLLAGRPAVGQALRRAFRKLRLETVERYLEARRMTAYLISFKSSRGTVYRLLDCLVTPAYAGQLGELGVALERDGVSKYTFQRYTKNARIGVFPRRWSFRDFHRMFQEDFRRIVAGRRTLVPQPGVPAWEGPLGRWDWDDRDLERVEIILHRFGLSGRNYSAYREPGATFLSRDALSRLQELFSEILEDDDLVALALYEGRDVVDLLLREPLAVLVADRVTLSPGEAKELEKKDARIREAVFQPPRGDGPEALARSYLEAGDGGTGDVTGGDEKRRRELVDGVAEVLLDQIAPAMVEVRAARLRQLAEALIEALEAREPAAESGEEGPFPASAIESRTTLFEEEVRALEARRERVIEDLVTALGVESPAQLEERIGSWDEDGRARALTATAEVLGTHLPELLRGACRVRCREIATSYLETLAEIAAVAAPEAETVGA